LANHIAFVEFSVGYIDGEIWGYEMPDANAQCSRHAPGAWGRVSV